MKSWTRVAAPVLALASCLAAAWWAQDWWLSESEKEIVLPAYCCGSSFGECIAMNEYLTLDNHIQGAYLNGMSKPTAIIKRLCTDHGLTLCDYGQLQACKVNTATVMRVDDRNVVLHHEPGVDWKLLGECGPAGAATPEYFRYGGLLSAQLARVVSILIVPLDPWAELSQYQVQSHRCNYAVKAVNKLREFSYELNADGTGYTEPSSASKVYANWYSVGENTAAKDRLITGSCPGWSPKSLLDSWFHACGNGNGMHFIKKPYWKPEGYPGFCEFDYNDGPYGVRIWVAVAKEGTETC